MPLGLHEEGEEQGGLNVIDFNVMNGVLKLKWLKSFMLNRNSVWFVVLNGILIKWEEQTSYYQVTLIAILY